MGVRPVLCCVIGSKLEIITNFARTGFSHPSDITASDFHLFGLLKIKAFEDTTMPVSKSLHRAVHQ